MKTFALGYGTEPESVAIWCREKAVDKVGRHFLVLNGGWNFWLVDDDSVMILDDCGPPKRIPVTIMWEGEVPHDQARHYNEAIPWIEGELVRKERIFKQGLYKA